MPNFSPLSPPHSLPTVVFRKSIPASECSGVLWRSQPQKALPLHPPTRPFIVPVSSPFVTFSALPVRTADHLTLGTADTNTLPPPSHDIDEAELFNSVAGVLARDSLNTIIHRVFAMKWTNEAHTHTHTVFWERVKREKDRERECGDRYTARCELDGWVGGKDGGVSMWRL